MWRLLRLLLVFWLWGFGAIEYIIPLLITVIADDITKVFLVFFNTLEALFLLFLIVGVLINGF